MLFQGQVGRGFQVVRAGVEREPKRADLATKGALRRGLGSPVRDLGLAAVQVQRAVTGVSSDDSVPLRFKINPEHFCCIQVIFNNQQGMFHMRLSLWGGQFAF